MFEPLLRITLPDHIAESITVEVLPAPGMTRRVIVIPQAWLLRRAEVSAKAIVERLVESGRIDIVATGDYPRDAQLVRPSVLETPEEIERRRVDAEERLARKDPFRPMDLPTYLALALPARVPLVGVGDRTLESAAVAARDARIAAVRELYRLGGSSYDPSAARFAHYDTIRDDRTSALDPIPILQRLLEHAATVKASSLSPELARADALVAAVHANIRDLPRLLRFARENGIRPERYPALLAVEKVQAAESANPRRIQSQWKWLQRAVLDRLVKGRLDPHGGLMALFERDLRLAIRDKPKENPLQSKRPLFDATRAEIRSMVIDLAAAAEKNERLSVHQMRKLLDLAALFGLDDRRFLYLRRLAAAQAEVPDGATILQQLSSLERDVVRRMTNRDNDRVELLRMVAALEDLERLAQEQMSAAGAKRALRQTPPVTEIAQFLRARGAPVTAAEMRHARFFDRHCAPSARRFYEACLDHSKRMAEALLDHLGGYGGSTAVLLCGGFHASAIVAELRDSQVACSTVMPAMSLKDESARVFDPEEIRKQVEGPNVKVHQLGPTIADVIHGRRDPESRYLPDGDDTPGPDTREWVGQKWMNTVLAELDLRMEHESASGVANECRVCRRQAAVATQRLVCGRGMSPDVVLECAKCQSFVCTRCAGRAAVPLLPGHGSADAQRTLRFAATLVCNLHATEVGPSSQRRRIGGRYAGHSWFA